MRKLKQDCATSVRRCGRQAFSLIELLAVGIMVLVMAAIIIPNYMTVRFRSREAQAQQNLDMMCKAQRLYFRANDIYADSGQEGDLQRIIDFSVDDGYWDYSIVSSVLNAGIDPNTEFVVRARQSAGAPVKEIYIDQTGTVFKNYEAPVTTFN